MRCAHRGCSQSPKPVQVMELTSMPSDARIQTSGRRGLVLIRSDVQDSDQSRRDTRRSWRLELGQVEAFEQVGPTWGDEVTDKAVPCPAGLLHRRGALHHRAPGVEDGCRGDGRRRPRHRPQRRRLLDTCSSRSRPATVIAFLTIMGYSLYDTIVVYDKVREIVGRLGADRALHLPGANEPCPEPSGHAVHQHQHYLGHPGLIDAAGGFVMAMGATAPCASSRWLCWSGIFCGFLLVAIPGSASLVSVLKEREERWRQIEPRRSGIPWSGWTRSTTRTRVIEPPVMRWVSTPGLPPRSSPSGGPAKRRPTMTAPTVGWWCATSPSQEEALTLRRAPRGPGRRARLSLAHGRASRDYRGAMGTLLISGRSRPAGPFHEAYVAGSLHLTRLVSKTGC